MSRRHFCTYFDHRYLARGLALHESLRRVCPDFTLWVLALDKQAEKFLAASAEPTLRVVPLEMLEAHDGELRHARAGRSLVEYYFTCSPCFPRFLLEHDATIESITYLDSDLYFFSSPEPIFSELTGYSVGITPHRFSARAARTHGRYGRYNVGWLTFRRDGNGIRCLEWWRKQCLEWCFDRVEGTKYADQGYLGEFAQNFSGVRAIAHPGANLAPWNIETVNIAFDGTRVTVDREPLIFFHFQGLKEVGARVYNSNLGGYGARLEAVARDGIFLPYIRTLRQCESGIGEAAPLDTANGIRRKRTGLAGMRARIGLQFYTMKAALSGNLIRI